jgi:Na+/H+ antiporter NhaC
MLRLISIALALVFFPVNAWAQELAADHYGWASILPALVAISAALILRSVIPALFLGLWLGAWLLAGFNFQGLIIGLLDAFQIYTLNALANADHAAIILFSFMISGLVGIISRNGGTRGIVNSISHLANSRRRGQLATFLMGLVVFIDDYANTLVVGNTMRPITDRLRISREKLAYLVDSTAAPVAAIALVTTWIGYEVGLIGEAVEGIAALDASPYLLFLNSIAYSFYPLLCIVLLLFVCWIGRDIGPMVAAERRAAASEIFIEIAIGPDQEENPMPERARNAVVPILVLIGGVVAGLYATGEGETLRAIIETADPYRALMWASLVAVLVALVMSLAQHLASLDQLLEAWLEGVKSIVVAMIILVLAWALSETAEALGTADFLASILGDSLPVGLLPAIVFLIAALTAFATGTSWGTMGILMPLAVPLAWALSQQASIAELYILHSTIAAVLAGAVWGDHCSPISDTTILSSMASDCDHIEHVRTQLPYALLAGGVALILGVLPSGFGFPWWLSLAGGAGLLAVILRIFGKKV